VPEASDAVMLTRERHDDDRPVNGATQEVEHHARCVTSVRFVSARNDEVELAAVI
jgi:hypothetical protein